MFGHSSESSGAFLTKTGGNSGKREEISMRIGGIARKNDGNSTEIVGDDEKRGKIDQAPSKIRREIDESTAKWGASAGSLLVAPSKIGNIDIERFEMFGLELNIQDKNEYKSEYQYEDDGTPGGANMADGK